MMSVVKIADLDFTMYFDYTDYGIIAHLDYHRWNKEVYKTSIPKVKAMIKKQTVPVFVEIYDKKDSKFLKYVDRCGFVPSGLMTENDTELFVWRDK